MINEALRLLRVFHDVSLTDLSKSLNAPISYLSEIESGKRRPSLNIINKYANHFKIRTSAIIFFSEEINTNTLSGSIKYQMRDKMVKLMQAMEMHGKE